MSLLAMTITLSYSNMVLNTGSNLNYDYKYFIEQTSQSFPYFLSGKGILTMSLTYLKLFTVKTQSTWQILYVNHNQ